MRPVLLFDLDETLYPERDYVLSGFAAVAERLAHEYNLDPIAAYTDMVRRLDAEGRGAIFDGVLMGAGVEPSPERVRGLVETYREHRPAIAFYPGVESMLRRLRQDYALAVVTDGLALMQRRKVEALGVPELVDTVVLCDECGAAKPDPAGFRIAHGRLGGGPALLVGDNPGHDMAAAAALGLPAVRVLSGRFAATATPPQWPAVEISGLDELEPLIARLLPPQGARP